MDELVKEQAISIAMERLAMSEDEVRASMKEVPEIDGFYFWQPRKGGGALLVNAEGETLGAVSSVSFAKHLEAFLSGRRS